MSIVYSIAYVHVELIQGKTAHGELCNVWKIIELESNYVKSTK